MRGHSAENAEKQRGGFYQKPDVLLRLELGKVLLRFRSGIHRSIQRGQGNETKSFKPYEPSDPLRSIDPFVSARVSQDPDLEPISRVYYPEKEITTVVLLDVGDCMTIPPRKEEYAATIFWLFALSTFRYGDRMRIIPFDGKKVYDSFWLGNEDAAEQFMNSIEKCHALPHRVSGATDAFSYVVQLSLRDAMIVVVSDFCMQWETCVLSLKRLGLREHSLQLLLLALDEWEGFTPHAYGITVRDPKTGRTRTMSMGKQGEMAHRADRARRRLSDIAAHARSLGGFCIRIPLIDDPLTTVLRFFLKMGWT